MNDRISYLFHTTHTGPFCYRTLSEGDRTHRDALRRLGIALRLVSADAFPGAADTINQGYLGSYLRESILDLELLILHTCQNPMTM